MTLLNMTIISDHLTYVFGFDEQSIKIVCQGITEAMFSLKG